MFTLGCKPITDSFRATQIEVMYTVTARILGSLKHLL